MRTSRVHTLAAQPPSPLPLITSLFIIDSLSTKLSRSLSIAPAASQRVVGFSCVMAIGSFWWSDQRCTSETDNQLCTPSLGQQQMSIKYIARVNVQVHMITLIQSVCRYLFIKSFRCLTYFCVIEGSGKQFYFCYVCFLIFFFSLKWLYKWLF